MMALMIILWCKATVKKHLLDRTMSLLSVAVEVP